MTQITHPVTTTTPDDEKSLQESKHEKTTGSDLLAMDFSTHCSHRRKDAGTGVGPEAEASAPEAEAEAEGDDDDADIGRTKQTRRGLMRMIRRRMTTGKRREREEGGESKHMLTLTLTLTLTLNPNTRTPPPSSSSSPPLFFRHFGLSWPPCWRSVVVPIMVFIFAVFTRHTHTRVRGG